MNLHPAPLASDAAQHALWAARGPNAFAQVLDADLKFLAGRLWQLDSSWKLTSKLGDGQSLWRLESSKASVLLTFEGGVLSYPSGGGRFASIAVTKPSDILVTDFLFCLGQELQPNLRPWRFPTLQSASEPANPDVLQFIMPKVYDSELGNVIRRLDRAIGAAGGGVTRRLGHENIQTYGWWGYSDLRVTLSGPTAGVELVRDAMLASMGQPSSPGRYW